MNPNNNSDSNRKFKDPFTELFANYSSTDSRMSESRVSNMKKIDEMINNVDLLSFLKTSSKEDSLIETPKSPTLETAKKTGRARGKYRQSSSRLVEHTTPQEFGKFLDECINFKRDTVNLEDDIYKDIETKKVLTSSADVKSPSCIVNIRSTGRVPTNDGRYPSVVDSSSPMMRVNNNSPSMIHLHNNSPAALRAHNNSLLTPTLVHPSPKPGSTNNQHSPSVNNGQTIESLIDSVSTTKRPKPTVMFPQRRFLHSPIQNPVHSNFYNSRLVPPPIEVVARRRQSLKIRLKPFTLTRMTEDQRARIDKLALIEDNLRYKFYRTITEVADILHLPRLRFTEVNQLRVFFNIFSKYGGYPNASPQFLNSIKKKLSPFHFKYLSYVLPLEMSGCYYRSHSNSSTKTKLIHRREDLNLALCIGIYDDIFFILDEMTQQTACLSEILNLFFLVSDILFKKIGITQSAVEKFAIRLQTKPYKIVLERMPVVVLLQIQELSFRIIVNFEDSKKTEHSLSEDVLETIIEAILSRKNHCTDKFQFDGDGIDQYLIRLITVMSMTIKPSKELKEFIMNDRDAETLLRMCSRVALHREVLREIFMVNEETILGKFKEHIESVEECVKRNNALIQARNESKTTMDEVVEPCHFMLLMDHRELESIILNFLPFIFKNNESVETLLNKFVEYKKGTDLLGIFFKKKKSSDVCRLIEYLKGMCRE